MNLIKSKYASDERIGSGIGGDIRGICVKISRSHGEFDSRKYFIC
jgi:hypothetical protein